jgi:hypothetical protein
LTNVERRSRFDATVSARPQRRHYVVLVPNFLFFGFFFGNFIADFVGDPLGTF